MEAEAMVLDTLRSVNSVLPSRFLGTGKKVLWGTTRTSTRSDRSNICGVLRGCWAGAWGHSPRTRRVGHERRGRRRRRVRGRRVVRGDLRRQQAGRPPQLRRSRAAARRQPQVLPGVPKFQNGGRRALRHLAPRDRLSDRALRSDRLQRSQGWMRFNLSMDLKHCTLLVFMYSVFESFEDNAA